MKEEEEEEEEKISNEEKEKEEEERIEYVLVCHPVLFSLIPSKEASLKEDLSICPMDIVHPSMRRFFHPKTICRCIIAHL